MTDDLAFLAYPARKSKIEIPNIRIPKIEIPKIEFPGFTKVVAKKAVEEAAQSQEEDNTKSEERDNFEISDIYLEDENGQEYFWGFTIAVLRVPEVFEDSTNALSKFKYNLGRFKFGIELVFCK